MDQLNTGPHILFTQTIGMGHYVDWCRVIALFGVDPVTIHHPFTLPPSGRVNELLPETDSSTTVCAALLCDHIHYHFSVFVSVSKFLSFFLSFVFPNFLTLLFPVSVQVHRMIPNPKSTNPSVAVSQTQNLPSLLCHLICVVPFLYILPCSLKLRKKPRLSRPSLLTKSGTIWSYLWAQPELQRYVCATVKGPLVCFPLLSLLLKYSV